MLTSEEQNLYSRHLLLEEVGEKGQLRLKKSRVLVIGAGGLGCPVLQYLTAAGIGTIGIVDFDTVDKSNLQRQVLFNYDSIGKNKANEAKKRLSECNPFVNLNSFPSGINVENALEIIANFDIIADCTDNYSTRFLINDACVLLNKPLVYSAIYKFEGQVSVFNYKNGPTYRCLHPEMPKSDSISNCSESGVLGVLPGILGTLQANEVLKLALKIGEPLSGKLLIYNSLSNRSTSFNLAKSHPDIYTAIAKRGYLTKEDYTDSCSVVSHINEIDLEEFKNSLQKDVQLIDVREKNELPKVNHLEVLEIPMSELKERFSEINPLKDTIVFCKGGSRSRKAIQELNELTTITQISSLKNGIDAYIKSEKITQ
ncbi:MAG: HesA/MoeB/ThiF family protein [Crocinitomicaceae bacterium]|nr:HesA/MoeB/ThiF family protein [Crocinitomicaceae bacterium]